jgi:hypothetical protein
MKRLMFALVISGSIAGLMYLRSEAQQPAPKVADLMRKKLAHAQKVLEGIALNNFDEISRSAEELILVSKAAEWRVISSPQYEVHSNGFRRAAETLIDKAKDKNVDGAALAYVDLTLSCVKCHKYVRDTRMTALDKYENLARR